MSAEQLLTALFNGGIAIGIIGTVLALGLGYTLGELLSPLRRWVLVLVMIAANAIVMPALAWGIAEAFPLSDAYVTGIVLAAIGAGSAGGIKAAQLAKNADLAFAVSIVVVLELVDIVAVPLWAGKVVSGATISAKSIVENLLLLVLIPLALGLIGHVRYAQHAVGWADSLTRIANLAIGIALIAGIAVNWSTIKDVFGSWALVASLLIIVAGLALGWAVGLAADRKTRATTTLVTGMRWTSLGLIIIGDQLGGNPDYLGPAICFALLGFIIPFAAAVEIGRKADVGSTPA